jgi:ferredoxin-NADP reductase
MGITPMHSMVKYLTDAGEQRNIQLLYAVHSDSQLIFRELFESYDMQSTFVVEDPSPDWHGETGRITPERVVGMLQGNAAPLVYLSGPEPLIEALSDEVKKQGIAEHRIVTDFFPGYNQF